MGDTGEGSSNAAQSARSEDRINNTKKPGLLSRLFRREPSQSVQDPISGPTDDEPVARPTHGMINLRRLRVEDVAIPKAEITAVPDTITRDDLVRTFSDSGMTRLPVYQGTLDTPIGLIHLKDFALRHGFNGKGGRFSLKNMLRPLLFVPPSMPIGVLLQKMQTERRHMALVIDEYGGVDGLVTIEDLIEQVIGEIEDEHDVDEDKFWTREKSGSYLALAKTPLSDFQEATGISLTAHDSVDEEEIDTLGGLVFMLSGRVPVRGEVVPHPLGHEFEVVDADPRRIKRLRVRLGVSPDQARSTAKAEAPAPVDRPADQNQAGQGDVIQSNEEVDPASRVAAQ
jgi:magnesium and cobalt transporter